MPHVRVGGIDLYYEAHGTGPRVVMLAHGALGSIDFAEASGLKASALVALGLRVIAYDARDTAVPASLRESATTTTICWLASCLGCWTRST